MTKKDKILVDVITDMNIDTRNQDDYIEELDDRLACAEDTVKGLRVELITVREAYHIRCVEKDTRIKELEDEVCIFTNTIAIIDEICDEAGVSKDDSPDGRVGFMKEKIKNNKGVISDLQKKVLAQSCEACNISERLTQAIDQRERYIKRSNHFEAKASKVNIEKLKLLSLMKEYQYKTKPFTLYSTVMKHYKKWQKNRGKK